MVQGRFGHWRGCGAWIGQSAAARLSGPLGSTGGDGEDGRVGRGLVTLTWLTPALQPTLRRPQPFLPFNHCIHACVLAYVNACMHTCMRVCVHACVFACIQAYVRTYAHAYAPQLRPCIIEGESHVWTRAHTCMYTCMQHTRQHCTYVIADPLIQEITRCDQRLCKLERAVHMLVDSHS